MILYESSHAGGFSILFTTVFKASLPLHGHNLLAGKYVKILIELDSNCRCTQHR